MKTISIVGWGSRWRWSLMLLGVPMVFGAYLWGAVTHTRALNTDRTKFDQSAYQNYAIHLAMDSHYIGDRNRMPVYPFIQSLFYERGMDEALFFQRGQLVNIGVSVLVLTGIGLVFFWQLALPLATILFLATAFTVFVFKAGYVQAEILFYGLFFIAYLLMLWMLLRPSWWQAGLLGICIGVSHLTKASLQPATLMFVVALIFRGILIHRGWRAVLQHLGWGALTLAACAAVLFPYLQTSKRVFGRYFYNVNSTFYFWCDSWEEAKQGTKAHGDRVGWPDMPPDQIPSPRKYFREHTPRNIVGRIVRGLQISWRNHTRSGYGYAKYALVYGVCALVATVMSWRRLNSLEQLALWFSLTLWGGYVVLYAWYVPIAQGQRFMLALWLPVVFFCGRNLTRAAPHWLCYVNGAMGVVLAVDIAHILAVRLHRISGGA